MDAEEQSLLDLQRQFVESQDLPSASIRRTLNTELPRDSHCGDNPELRPLRPEPLSQDWNGAPGTDRMATEQDDPACNVIKGIVEREIQAQDRVECHSVQSVPSPRPKKIDWKSKTRSGFGQSRFLTNRRTVSEQEVTEPNHTLEEQINTENKKKLASMSKEEILATKNELTASLEPSVLAAILRRRERTKTEARHSGLDFGPQFVSENVLSVPQVKTASAERFAKQNSGNIAVHEDPKEYTSVSEALQDEQNERQHSSMHDTTGTQIMPVIDIHFPQAPESAELDPDSDTFLQDLKTKYFPDLDYDPSSLAWMQKPTITEDESTYHESLDSLMPAHLRFDFQGNFLAPRSSREIDGNIGLHHHADAPLAAGYTIPELSRLCRSSYPAQACIALQTIGRVMYKIGKQFYGPLISEKLKRLVDTSEVERTMLERARDRHMGVSSYATEALWQANLGREGQILEGM